MKRGIKLPNTQGKSQASKVKWLIELVSTPERKSHPCIFENLIGPQKGNITGRDLLFLPRSYMTRHLKTKNLFYKEALLAISSLEITKGLPNIEQWDKEHLFYDGLFSLKTNKDKEIPINRYYEQGNYYTFGQFLDEKTKQVRNLESNRK